MASIDEVRRDPQAAVRAMRKTLHADVQLLEIAEWHGREYAVVGTVKLKAGLQRLVVIDVTDLDTNHGGGDAADYRAVREQQMEELEQHVDAGGSIGL